VRRKLIVATIGIILAAVGFLFSTIYIVGMVESELQFPYFLLFPSKLVGISGLFLIIYGFQGYSFFLELAWRNNLIALDVIMRENKRIIYHKAFLEDKGRGDELIFAGGISQVEKFITEFSKSKQDVGVLSLENKFILLAQGEKIITTMMVKKKLEHAEYVLNELNKKIEVFFWDYLKNFEFYDKKPFQLEVVKTMEMLIRSIIKL
jgi:hypothetical protein